MFPTKIFDERKTYSDGQGKAITGAQNSETAMRLGGLDYKVALSEMIVKDTGRIAPKRFAAYREDNGDFLGDVGNQYTIVQNAEALEFTDNLFGMGARYTSAGYFGKGEKIWVEMIIPGEYTILGDKITPYVAFINSFDGGSAVKVCATPVRIWCSNTLNMAIKEAVRCFSFVHKGSISAKMDEARQVLGFADAYMKALNNEIERLALIKVSPIQFEKIILPTLIKLDEKDKNDTKKVEKVMQRRAELRFRYREAPDLQGYGNNGARVIHAVADYVDHKAPERATPNWREKRFEKQVEKGNAMLDQARDLILSIA